MSPVALTLDLLLAALLLITLGFGMRLDKRLKALNASQDAFAEAVADLDAAAARAERGLADLHAAMDEAVDLLAGRIEKARDLAARLDGLTGGATADAAAAERGPAAPRRSALDRAWPRAANASAPMPEPQPPLRRLAPEPLTLTRSDAFELRSAPPRPAPAQPRSRAPIDDDLFAATVLRRAAGGRP
jgi:hypothetical protein